MPFSLFLWNGHMASVFEAFGWKSQSAYTLISPLGIENRINQLQIQSQKYFTIGEKAQAADGDQLGVTVQANQAFNLAKPEHRAQLQACIALFKEQSAALKSIDKKIALSVVLGVVASSLSFISFVGYFGILGWGAAAWFLYNRANVSKEYQESLKLLVATCNWTLGPSAAARCSQKEGLTQDPDIREMMSLLYPALNEQQIKHLVADDIEEVFARELRDYEKQHLVNPTINRFFSANADERIARSKRSAEFTRCIYGYNKGGARDYIDAFLSIFPDLYHAIIHGFKRAQHWWSKGAVDKGVTEPTFCA